MISKKIVVTGLGLMTGVGLNLESSWNGLINGQSPIKPFSLFDPQGLQCTFGVELPSGAEKIFADTIKTRNRNQMTRSSMIALVTAQMAFEDAGLNDFADLDKTRVGAVIGTSGTGYDATNQDNLRILRNMVSSPAAWISLKWKLQGPSFVVSTACSSGAYALHSAYLLLISGACDCLIVGAADSSINYKDVEGFCSLLALSDEKEEITRASRPFDKKRNGFVMGEGAGMMILETEEHAKARGALIYAKMSAPGLCSEAYNILSPEPSGVGMARSMRLALKNASLDISQIDYINAHGTSTILNDLYETQAIKEVFGNKAYTIPVSSTKSMTGHCLGASSSIESVICCKALVENIIPPTANIKEPDEGLDLDYVPGVARKKELTNVMTNSFAFGGHNGVCIFSKE